MSTNKSFSQNALSAVIASMPLSLAVVPWGILCATLCMNIGMTALQAQLMSLLVFAGAAQISGTAILGAGGSWIGLINSTTMISVRHLLYSANYKDEVSVLPLWKRLIFAFLLTDEMFAIAQNEQNKTGKFDYWYAVIAGFSFYVVWNLATFAGIIFTKKLQETNNLQDIDTLGLDFAIVATFIAMVVPMIKESKYNRKALFIASLVSGIFALVFEMMHMSQGLIFAGLIGMTVGTILTKSTVNNQPREKDADDGNNNSSSNSNKNCDARNDNIQDKEGDAL